MVKTVFGLFNNRNDAESAVSSLESRGYNPKDISIIMRDTKEGRDMADKTGADVVGEAASGAVTGGALGALAGLLIGIGAIAIPGIGGILIGGPVAAALGLTGAAATTVSGAVTGALAGGLVGALTGLGVPESEARIYEERIKSGSILLAVPAKSGEEDEVREILRENNASNINSVTTQKDEVTER